MNRSQNNELNEFSIMHLSGETYKGEKQSEGRSSGEECKAATTKHHHYTHHITKRKIPFIFDPKRVVNLCLTVFIPTNLLIIFLRLSFLFTAAKTATLFLFIR
jgi:hypothetical protein